MRNQLVVVLLVIVALVGTGVGYFVGVSNQRTTTTTTSTSSQNPITTCNITGQPANFYLRVLSDATQQPLAGVAVTATNSPAFCNNTPADSRNSRTFTTNGTGWVVLDGTNNAGYFIVATYSGQTYTLSGNLYPISATCATLFLPSGRTSVTVAYSQPVCK